MAIFPFLRLGGSFYISQHYTKTLKHVWNVILFPILYALWTKTFIIINFELIQPTLHTQRVIARWDFRSQLQITPRTLDYPYQCVIARWDIRQPNTTLQRLNQRDYFLNTTWYHHPKSISSLITVTITCMMTCMMITVTFIHHNIITVTCMNDKRYMYKW